MQQQSQAHTRLPSIEPPRHPDQQQWEPAAAARAQERRRERQAGSGTTPRVPGVSRRRESYTARWVDETTYNGNGVAQPEAVAYDAGATGNGYAAGYGYGATPDVGYGAPGAGYGAPDVGYGAGNGDGYTRR